SMAGEAESRLYGLRLVHTHTKPGGLSGNDLTMLFLNRLDAIVAFDVTGSNGSLTVGPAQLAMVAPASSDQEDWLIDEPTSLRQLESVDILERVHALEEELAREAGARQVARTSAERAVLVGLATGADAATSASR